MELHDWNSVLSGCLWNSDCESDSGRVRGCSVSHAI